MRLFYGLSLPAHIRQETARACALAQSVIPGRYALASNHHITLAFIGDVDPSRLRDAASALQRCVSAFPAPRITLTEPDSFGRPQNAILILRAQSNPPLEPLHAALRGALHDLRLPASPGPFSPHVTLARHALLPQTLPRLTAEPLTFTAENACLFLSARDRSGVLRYTPIFAVRFPDSGT